LRTQQLRAARLGVPLERAFAAEDRHVHRAHGLGRRREGLRRCGRVAGLVVTAHQARTPSPAATARTVGPPGLRAQSATTSQLRVCAVRPVPPTQKGGGWGAPFFFFFFSPVADTGDRHKRLGYRHSRFVPSHGLPRAKVPAVPPPQHDKLSGPSLLAYTSCAALARGLASVACVCLAAPFPEQPFRAQFLPALALYRDPDPPPALLSGSLILLGLARAR